MFQFVDIKTLLSNFFTNDEVIFYKSINDLSEKIIKYSNDDKQRIRIAKSGKKKYMKHFNSTVVADYIINKTLDNKYKKNKYLWDTE